MSLFFEKFLDEIAFIIIFFPDLLLILSISFSNNLIVAVPTVPRPIIPIEKLLSNIMNYSQFYQKIT